MTEGVQTIAGRHLDAAYDNQSTVADMQGIRKDWAARSENVRRKHGGVLDIRFGEGGRERLDLFLAPDANSPTVTYVHGGYWQANDKENYAFVAEGPLSAGFNVAIIEYTIAPEGTIEQMTAEMGRAISWLSANLARYRANPERLYMTGHSSGGHLTAQNITHPGLRGGIALSGIFDLRPMCFTRYNDKLCLTEQSAMTNSPTLSPPDRSVPLLVAYGGAELPEFRRQSVEFVEAWNKKGLRCDLLEIPGANHFSVVEALATPGPLVRELTRMAESDSFAG
jgi:arylformamidase